ncbi:hypothetical protein GCM10027059_26050 [Myceligenerans halotolerans]
MTGAGAPSVKMLRERLCAQQGAASVQESRIFQALIDLCDVLRPLGPDGKHGGRHTPLCGCDDDVRVVEQVITPDLSGLRSRLLQFVPASPPSFTVLPVSVQDVDEAIRDGLAVERHGNTITLGTEPAARAVFALLEERGLLTGQSPELPRESTLDAYVEHAVPDHQAPQIGFGSFQPGLGSAR